jgi:DNA-binding transcriptional LysR family regulator
MLRVPNGDSFAGLVFQAGVETIKYSEQPVTGVNTLPADSHATLSGLDWSDLRHLLAVGQSGSLRAAARDIGVSVNTVRAHLARLERAIGAPLISRDYRGAALTSSGETLYRSILDMSKTPLVTTAATGDSLLCPGRMTIACSEGIGVSWLTPHIARLATMLSPLTVDLQFDYDLGRDNSAVADVGICFRPPANPNLIVAKLATLHFMMFASQDYLKTYGMPETMDDLRHHMFVEQAAPGYNSTAIDLLLGSDRPRSTTAIRTNSTLTQAYAATNGAGIAILPSFTRAITRTLIPLSVMPQMRFPVFYYFRAEARRSATVRAVIDWMKGAFDPVRYPWFAEDFVHPDQFGSALADDERVVSLFEHMIDRAYAQRRPVSKD